MSFQGKYNRDSALVAWFSLLNEEDIPRDKKENPKFQALKIQKMEKIFEDLSDKDAKWVMLTAQQRFVQGHGYSKNI